MKCRNFDDEPSVDRTNEDVPTGEGDMMTDCANSMDKAEQRDERDDAPNQRQLIQSLDGKCRQRSRHPMQAEMCDKLTETLTFTDSGAQIPRPENRDVSSTPTARV